MQWELIRERRERQLTQKDLANVLGISMTAYRLKETGTQDFKAKEMFKLARFFGKDIGDLFTDTTSRKVKREVAK